MVEVCMKPIFLTTFCGAAFSLLLVAPAQGLEDRICRGQDTFTGVVLNSSTIETSGFFCNRADVRAWPPTSPKVTLPPLIHVQFKDASVAVKIGDTLTLKGSLYNVNDEHLQMGGWLLKDAEIVKDVPGDGSSPADGTEVALHRYIQSLERGAPNYDEMEPRLAQAIYQRTPWILSYIQQVGALKGLRFLFADSSGINVYQADFERGAAEWLIAPLSTSGKVRMQGFLPLPASLRCITGITYIGDPVLHISVEPWQCRQWGG
jgi:hypothetical protein